MQVYSASFAALWQTMWRHKRLIFQMVKRDVVGRYRGSLLGLFWSFITPLLMLVIYSLVFSGILNVRWSQGTDTGTGEYAIILFVGLIVHGFFAESVTRAATVVVQQPNFVKKIVFPLEILAPTVLGAALFHLCVSGGVLLLAIVAVQHHLPLTALWLPVIVMPFLLLTLGIAWILTSLGVYFRDLSQFLGLCMTVLLFLSPILFPVAHLPTHMQPYIYMNPLSLIVEQLRNILLWGHMPAWKPIACYFLVSIATLWLGFAWFQRTRRGFADVL